ncbi:putative dihydrodipicolinate synthetase protein [Sesbania bispinosa]|nr:putative dihydrodipicolinate synthetase protein [Sesbania bispinosa]
MFSASTTPASFTASPVSLVAARYPSPTSVMLSSSKLTALGDKPWVLAWSLGLFDCGWV